MSLTPAMIDALLAAGGTVEQLAAVVKADLAEQETRKAKKRENGAARQQRWRDKRKSRRDNADNALRDVTPPIDRIHTPASEISPSGETQKVKRARQQFPCPPDCDELDWGGLLQNREQARKPVMTASAYRTIVGKLEGWARDGWPPGPILANSAEKGWLTVFPTDEMKAQSNGRQPRPANDFGSLRGRRPNGALDMVLEAERELQAEAQRQNPGHDWPPRAALPPH